MCQKRYLPTTTANYNYIRRSYVLVFTRNEICSASSSSAVVLPHKILRVRFVLERVSFFFFLGPKNSSKYFCTSRCAIVSVTAKQA
ncbi:unnamed protein product [Allacma fusca]|uniref:Uncharacterized protein n=1 Tax=Allacma fusca TaxID=39272 RepID=A0A8J2P6W9_9HEXA|nr:unnamed protein product [Allacma fusca]